MALLYYNRLEGKSIIGYEDDLYSGITPDFGPYEADNALIQAIAERRGDFEEFKQNGHQRKPAQDSKQ